MTDLELANELLLRLNKLIQDDDDVRRDVGKLVDAHIPCSKATADHPTIQVGDNSVGFLGVLNGLAGVLPDGPKKGWGYITAVMGDDGELLEFILTGSDPEEDDEESEEEEPEDEADDNDVQP